MKIQKIIGAAIILAALGAHAQNETGETGRIRGFLTGEASAEKWAGWAPFVGLNAGYMSDDSDQLRTEGIPGSVKIIGSFVTPNMHYVFDGGVGYNHQRFSSSQVLDRDLGTTIGEIAARYQWENRWQAGVVWNTLFNKGENYGANQADAQFAGIQGLREFAISNDWMMRLGARYMTDINVPNTFLSTVMIDVQFGYNPWSGRQGVEQAAYVPPAEATAAEADANATADTQAGMVDENVDRGMAGVEDERAAITDKADKTTDKMKSAAEAGAAGTAGAYGGKELTARRDFLLFDVSSSTLNAEETDRLNRLAAALNDNPDMVDKIEVIGYADPSGDATMNQQLSHQRAESVKQALVAKGVPEDKIAVVARGEEAPMGSYQKSRRAELRFQGVNDPDALKRAVQTE